MSLDTAAARASVVGLMSPWSPGVWPGAALDQAERQAAGYAYAGLLLNAPAAVADPDFVLPGSLFDREQKRAARERDDETGVMLAILAWIAEG